MSFKMLMPKECVASFRDINLQKLLENGIKLIILDIDNTLAPPHTKNPENDVLEWVEKVKACGFSVCLMSNNHLSRVELFNKDLQLHAIHRALKPLRLSYLKVLKHFDVTAKEACMVGDQVLTDICGANRMGMYSILVDRITDTGKLVRKHVNNIDDKVRRRMK